jgi:two-component system, NtrC family, response regulator HydG
LKEFEKLCEVLNVEQSILLIDDDEDFIRLFSRFLRQNGFQIDTATDGVEAVAKVISRKEICHEVKPYSVIFLDLKLPKIAGENVLILIKKLMPLVPIVILSGYVDRDVKDRALKKGALILMEKPTTLSEEWVNDVLVQLNLKS